jgi:DNA-3-methyladenine glycosylase
MTYYLNDKASHSSLGYTEKRKAMFMPPGTIYMYYARGHDSLNFSARGEGNVVLVKAAYPYVDTIATNEQIEIMRSISCRSLALKVPNWAFQLGSMSICYIGLLTKRNWQIGKEYKINAVDSAFSK